MTRLAITPLWFTTALFLGAGHPTVSEPLWASSAAQQEPLEPVGRVYSPEESAPSSVQSAPRAYDVSYDLSQSATQLLVPAAVLPLVDGEVVLASDLTESRLSIISRDRDAGLYQVRQFGRGNDGWTEGHHHELRPSDFAQTGQATAEFGAVHIRGEFAVLPVYETYQGHRLRTLAIAKLTTEGLVPETCLGTCGFSYESLYARFATATDGRTVMEVAEQLSTGSPIPRFFRSIGDEWIEQPVSGGPLPACHDCSLEALVDNDTAIVAYYYDYYAYPRHGMPSIAVYRFDGTAWRRESAERTQAIQLSADTRWVNADRDRIAVVGSGDHGIGVVSIYHLDGQGWKLEQTLTNPSWGHDKRFGERLQIGDNWMALWAESVELCIGEPCVEIVGYDPTKTYLFAFDGDSWERIARLNIDVSPVSLKHGRLLAIKGECDMYGWCGELELVIYELRAEIEPRTWVGRQTGCELAGSGAGSFFDENNWLNYETPGGVDLPVFGSGLDLAENGDLPHYIHFGDFCANVFACPDEVRIPGGRAWTAGLDIQAGSWTFDFGPAAYGGCDWPQAESGSYELVGGAPLILGDIVESTGLEGRADLTLRGPGKLVGDLDIGVHGVGDLIVMDGATLESGVEIPGTLGVSVGAEGTVTISGRDATWLHDTDLLIGDEGVGTVSIEQYAWWTTHGTVLVGHAVPGAEGSITIADSSWDFDSLVLGDFGTGSLFLSDSAWTRGERLEMARQAGSHASAVLTGTEVHLSLRGDLLVGGQGVASLSLTAGAGVECSSASQVLIGDMGTGSVTLADGAYLWASKITIGNQPGACGSLRLEGDDTSCTSLHSMMVGLEGRGSVTITDSANLGADEIIIGEAGELTGDGKVMAKVLNRGLLAPWMLNEGLRISGDYSQTTNGTLDIDIAKHDDPPTLIPLVIDGRANFSGTLRVGVGHAIQLHPGTRVPLVTFGSFAGGFDRAVAPSLPDNLTVRLDWTPTKLVTEVIRPFDFNADSFVNRTDAAKVFDCASVSTEDGAGGYCIPADADHDGDVDLRDIAALQNVYSP